MSVATVDAGGSFRVGDVFSRAWAVFAGNFILFVGIVFLIYLVIALTVGVLFGLAYVTGQLTPSQFGAPLVISVVVTAFIAISANMVGQAAILFVAFQYLSGQPARMGEATRRAIGRLFPVLGLTLLLGLAVGLGLVLLVVPGIILIAMWAVVVPVCVVEGLGPTCKHVSQLGSLPRAIDGRYLGILLLISIANGVSNKLVWICPDAGHGTIVATLGTLLAGAIVTAYGHCVFIMMYHDLRVAKEGIGTEQIAAAFD